MTYLRDHLLLPLADDYFERRRAEGWRLRVIEWEQDSSAASVDEAREASDVPFGLEVVSGSLQLAQNPGEIAVLLAILEMIVKDQSVSVIAEELNRRSFKTRAGNPWTSTAVFDLLPRVIEMGPSLLRSPQWINQRPAAVMSR
jgi:hypothetical protein